MELPRGMRDLESTELYKIHTIREKFEETASIFGFKMVDPSPIESLSTLEAKSGPEIRKEIYNFSRVSSNGRCFICNITRWDNSS